MEVETGVKEEQVGMESVFDRLEEPAVGSGEGQNSSVFQRLDIPTADPAMWGRREQ
jgi:hypothetical protein